MSSGDCNEFFYLALHKSLRNLATVSGHKHTKCKIVEDVAVITIDSPGVKVKFFFNYL